MAPPYIFWVGNMEDYDMMWHLGEGSSSSVVFLARHRATGQTVAIKRFGEHVPPLSVLREATFLVSCRGIPHVVDFHGLVRHPVRTKELGIVTEYVGPSLGTILRRQPQPPPQLQQERFVRRVMWQLLWGASAMHARGVVHRDIKPDNVLLDEHTDAVKICDLGLALCTASDARSYGLAGTLWYMAPEMLLGKTDYGAGVDVWSLGCVMAELLLGGGRVLFPGRENSTGSQLCAIIGVLGVPSPTTWPWFYSTEFAAGVLTEVQDNLLSERFPALSPLGLDLLNGLLTWNPDKRLTASAALMHPWF